jgi:hypothetical protein
VGLFRWLERKVFLGEVIEDYGVLEEQRYIGARARTSVLLCRRKGRIKLVFRVAARAPFGASVNYTMIDATPASLSKLGEALSDAQRVVDAETPEPQ